MTDTTATDRCQGVLIGLAAGDQIGGPIRMAVRLAESLLDCGGFDAADILERYLRWWRAGAFDTGPCDLPWKSPRLCHSTSQSPSPGLPFFSRSPAG